MPGRAVGYLQGMRPWAMVLAGALLVGASGCGPRPNTPAQVIVGEPRLAFEIALSTLRTEGYSVVHADPVRGSICARAKLDGASDGRAPVMTNYVMLQAYADGSLAVWAWGHLVTDDGAYMHRALRGEVDRVAQRIQEVALLYRPSPYGPPPGAPVSAQGYSRPPPGAPASPVGAPGH